MSVAPLLNTTNTTTTNATNTTSPGSGDGNNRNNNTAWVAPIAVIVPLVFLCVVCIVWGRWVYKRGKKRYWQRVQNEHLMAYGATEDSGQTYGIGELYENKYFASDHFEEIHKNLNHHTIKGNEEEQRKSLSRQHSADEKKWYEQTDNHLTVPAAASSSNCQQEDSGILSNRTSDNISESTLVDRIDEENINVTLQERNSDKKDSKHVKETEQENHEQKDSEASRDQQSKDEASEGDHAFEITITCKSSKSTTETTQKSTADKILTTDV